MRDHIWTRTSLALATIACLTLGSIPVRAQSSAEDARKRQEAIEKKETAPVKEKKKAETAKPSVRSVPDGLNATRGKREEAQGHRSRIVVPQNNRSPLVRQN